MTKVKYVDHMPQIQIEVLNNKVDLDHPCHNCVTYISNGYHGGPNELSGWRKGYENGEHCKQCDNKRFYLTEEGQAIMDLVKRHIGS